MYLQGVGASDSFNGVHEDSYTSRRHVGRYVIFMQIEVSVGEVVGDLYLFHDETASLSCHLDPFSEVVERLYGLPGSDQLDGEDRLEGVHQHLDRLVLTLCEITVHLQGGPRAFPEGRHEVLD